jgi:hypothetical protein
LPPSDDPERGGMSRPAHPTDPIPHPARPLRRAHLFQENIMTHAINATPNTDADFSDWETKAAAHDRLRAELQPCNRTALFDALAVVGVTHVVVSFDGYGDSGQIENIEVKVGDATVAMPETKIEISRAEWGKPDPERSLVSVGNAIEALAYDLLGQAFCGWENNEGAYGEFTFDVAARSITLDYNQRFTDSEHSQHIF